jgi:anaerobic magnesium-protoporphyrin IX monomethyl ester cyclase
VEDFLKRTRILLINPRRGFTSSEYGLGYQIPLGLVKISGPLIDAGYKVRLIDADAERMGLDELLKEAKLFSPDILGVSHTGSTAAHLQVVKAIKALRSVLPKAKIVYGGVYPTFAFRWLMESIPEIDVIVRGEGEATMLELVSAFAEEKPLSEVLGIVWRDNQKIKVNQTRPPLKNLDDYRSGWELVNWNLYKLLGDKAAGVQFSRGCPNACGFCGQWIFWRCYRHKSPEIFASEIKYLADTYGVRHVWPADEHFTADRQALEKVLRLLANQKPRVSLSINASVDSVIRDKDILPLYKEAGIDFVAMGVESDDDEVVAGFGKTSYQMAYEAVRLLRRNKILACVNVIYGLEDESWRTIWRKYRRLRKMNPDFVNATYLTPHFWTPMGSKVPIDKLIQPDLSKWGYRHQIVDTPNLTPRQLFIGVKATEFFLHLRPRHLLKFLFSIDKPTGRMFRRALWQALIVWLVEIFSDHPKVKFLSPGEIEKFPELVRLAMPRAKLVNKHLQ